MEAVGVYREGSEIHLACLSRAGGEVVIGRLDKGQEALLSKKDSYIVTGIEGQELLIRHLKSPLKSERALHKTLPFQLEALIPYKLDDVVVKPIYIPDEKETEALFFTVSKKNLCKHLTQSQEEGVHPRWVSAVPMALARFAALTCPQHMALIVFYVGASNIQLVSLKEGKVLSHLTLHMGFNDFKQGKSQKVVAKLKREVDRAFCFLAHKEKIQEEREVLFCGQMAEEIESLLIEDEGCLLKGIKGEGLGNFTWEEMSTFAVPIGLAIDALKNDRMSIQFLQGEFSSKRCIGGIKKKLIRGASLAGALFLTVLMGSQLYFGKKEKTLLREVSALTERYVEDLPHLKKVQSKDHIELVLQDINQALRVGGGKNNTFSSPPLVSHVLAFLSTHPLLEGIEVTHFEYGLKTYPTLEAPKEGYLPKVKLIFISPEAKKARAFHDAIVEDETIVDNNREIEWNRNENTYEISFYLRA
ncbi:MAG: hypothetical protein KDK76_05715 [Chlamydiia bacterium]|nr:hypothetical protein [Chlamydiia bacterium]